MENSERKSVSQRSMVTALSETGLSRYSDSAVNFAATRPISRVTSAQSLSRNVKQGVHTVHSNISKAGRAVQRAVESTVQHTVGQVIDTVRRTQDNATTANRVPKLTYQQYQAAATSSDARHGAVGSRAHSTLTPVWYTVEFDALAHMLNDVNVDISLHTIQHHIDDYTAAQQYNDKQLSDEVTSNHASYVAGVASIDSTQSELTDITAVIQTLSQQVQLIQHHAAHQQLHLMYNHRRKQRLLRVVLALTEILDLISKEQQLRALLASHHFIDAVQLYKQCIQKLSQSHMQRYECLLEWRSRFIQTSEMLSQSVRRQLLTLCTAYEQTVAENVVQGMLSMGEIAMLPELLKTYVSKALHNSSAAVVRRYLQSTDLSSASAPDTVWEESIRQLPARHYRDVVLSLCELYCNTLHSNHCLIQYISHMYSAMLAMAGSGSTSSSAVQCIEQTQHLLLELRQSVTQSMIQRLCAVLGNMQLTKQSISLTNAIHTFNALNTFCTILHHYSRTSPTTLSTAIIGKCREYVRAYHTATIQDIQSRLEKEKWTVTTLDIKAEQQATASAAASFSVLRPVSSEIDRSALCQQCTDGRNPYTTVIQFMQQNTNNLTIFNLYGITLHSPLSVSVVNVICQYIHMYFYTAHMVPAVASEYVACIRDTYDMYVYTVFCYFGVAQTRFFLDQYAASTDKYTALKGAVNTVKQRVEAGTFAYGHYKQHIQTNNGALQHSSRQHTVPVKGAPSSAQSRQYELENSRSLTATASFDLLRNLHRAADAIERGIDNMVPIDKTVYPELCQASGQLRTQQPDSLYGVGQRVVAAEAVQRISELLAALHAAGRERQHVWQKSWCDMLQYSATVSADLHRYIYRNITPFVLRPAEWLPRLQQCKLVNVLSHRKCNAYVSEILRCCADSEQKLQQYALPHATHQHLWTVSIQFLCEKLIDEYSSASRQPPLTAESVRQCCVDVEALQHGLALIVSTGADCDVWATLTVWLQLWTHTATQLVQYVQTTTHTYTDRQVLYVVEHGAGSKLSGPARHRLVQDAEDALVQAAERRRKARYLAAEMQRAELYNTDPTMLNDIQSELSRSQINYMQDITDCRQPAPSIVEQDSAASSVPCAGIMEKQMEEMKISED